MGGIGREQAEGDCGGARGSVGEAESGGGDWG